MGANPSVHYVAAARGRQEKCGGLHNAAVSAHLGDVLSAWGPLAANC
jgi:hypothetical protein